MASYLIKIVRENGKEAYSNIYAKDSWEAFEKVKLTYPDWKSLTLEDDPDIEQQDGEYQ